MYNKVFKVHLSVQHFKGLFRMFVCTCVTTILMKNIFSKTKLLNVPSQSVPLHPSTPSPGHVTISIILA